MNSASVINEKPHILLKSLIGNDNKTLGSKFRPQRIKRKKIIDNK